MSIQAGANLYEADTVAQFGLGDTLTDGANNAWMYIEGGSGGLAAEQIATLNASFVGVSGTSTTSGSRPTQVVLCPYAIAEGSFGWALTGPFSTREDGTEFNVQTSAASAINVAMYTSATAGKVDDGDGSGDVIAGLTLTESGAGGAGTYSCQAVTRMTTNC